MAKWDDLPGELHAEIWEYFCTNVVTSLLHVDNEPFETFVAECTAEISKEEREREEERRHETPADPCGRRDSIRSEKRYAAFKKARDAEKVSDRLAIEHAVLVSKGFAWSLRGHLEDRLKAIIKNGRTIKDEYRDLRYTHRGSMDNPERAAYSWWQSELSRRIKTWSIE
jgi:hypothetical protein